MNFDVALNIYLRNVENLQHRFMRKLISQDERDTGLALNRSWFHDIFTHLDDCFKELQLGELSDEMRQKYDVTPLTFPLCSVILYRDHEIPCYDDDYGQQVFAIYNGQEWAGGAYNFYYELDFCFMLDHILEKEQLDKIAAEYGDGE